MINHDNKLPFHRASLPLRPEEAVITLLETQIGTHQVIVNGVAHPIAKEVAEKLRDDLIRVYGR